MRTLAIPALVRLRAGFLVLVLGLSLGLPAMPATAQELPECDGWPATDCVLPGWPEASQLEAPSLFGPIEGGVWLEDAVGDAPPDGIDLVAVGIGHVDIAEPGPIRRAEGLMRRGRRARAVPRGAAHVIRIVLDRPISDIAAGHAGVHIATDVDGARSNNAPAGVADPGSPWSGWQDVYSLTHATTTGESRLLYSDLARGWYKGRGFAAAAWAAPHVLDILVRPRRLGDSLFVTTFTNAGAGGYDVIGAGGAIPIDGRVGLVPACSEASILVEPFSVPRLEENGQTLRNVNVPASWRGGAAFPISGDARAALASLIEAEGGVGGRIALASDASLLEGGLIIRQRPAVEVALDGDVVQLALELGLTQRGHNLLRDVVLEPTSEPIADAWLSRATRALVEAQPPFRSTKKSGPLHGGATGSCVPALIEAPSMAADLSAEPAEGD